MTDMSTQQTVRDMAGAIVPQPCMDLASTPDAQRLCCHRTSGHFPRQPHADQDDSGQLVEWR
jgi:hypothetical protein